MRVPIGNAHLNSFTNRFTFVKMKKLEEFLIFGKGMILADLAETRTDKFWNGLDNF